MKKFNLDYKYKNTISDRKMYIIREKLTGTQNVGEFLRRQCCGSGTFYKNKTNIYKSVSCLNFLIRKKLIKKS